MNYLIIGGNSSVAGHLIKGLLEDGKKCTVISRSEIGIKNPNLQFHKADIVKDGFPAVDLPENLEGLVYFPGNIHLKPFRTLSQDDFKEAYDINFLGAVKSIQAAESSLKRSSSASVVLFSSVAVKTGMPFHAAISSAKGAVEGLTRSLAAEFAPKIRVNAIAPSLTNTKMAERYLNSEAKIEASKNRHPLKEIGSPQNIAELVKFLLYDQSKWITGQIIAADGGLSSLKTS